MISIQLFRGDLVRLTAEDPETLAKSFTRWARDSFYLRLMDSDPARLHSVKAVKEWIEKELQGDPPKVHFFAIRTLADDRLIGDIDLFALEGAHRDAFVGIGIGERDDWGKGYGTDAMRLALRYAFTELNLHRVSLDVFEYNPRAIRSYEKAGFKHEGRQRSVLHRDGRRWDLLYMGILQSEWFAVQEGGYS
jgi:RimJ/RimL family protein N-acetyltransferase